MVARGAGKNETAVAETSLCSGKKKISKKFPYSTTQLFSLTDFVLILSVWFYYFALALLQLNPLDRHYNNIVFCLFWPG